MYYADHGWYATQQIWLGHAISVAVNIPTQMIASWGPILGSSRTFHLPASSEVRSAPFTTEAALISTRTNLIAKA
eukprot:893647-Amphidinium_carterae.2